jgi:hypothetical protein
MKKIVVLVLLACPTAWSQQWTNPELLGRSLPTEQYQTIGRGDLAQCTADARQTAAQSLPTQVCDMGQNPGAYYQCQTTNEAANENAKTLHRDLVVGCMARKGWLYK